MAILSASVLLNTSQMEEAAHVLVRSFVDDPGLHFVLPDRAARDRLGPMLARAAVRYALRCGASLTTPDGVRGVAL